MRVARLMRIALWLALALLLLPAQAHAAPVIVAAAASWAGGAIAGALGAAIGASAFFTSLASAAFGFVINSLASSLLFGKASAPEQDTGQSGFQAEARGRTQIVRSSVEPRRIILGEVMVSGPLIYAETTGSSNQYLHMVIPLAGHQCQEIGQVYLGDEPIGTLDAAGNVTSGRFANYVRVKKRLGAAGQVADADLIAESGGKWTAAHVGNGISDLYVRLQYSQDIFPNGIPNIKALTKGALVYDPRDAGTRYSNNWALGVRHYLRLAAIEGGLECDADEVDDVQAIAAANLCDERVTMAAYSTTFTADAATDTLTLAASERTIATGDGVQVAATSAVPGGLAVLTTYYFIRKTETTCQLATSAQNALLGTAINLTDAGAGTLTLSHIDQARYTINGTIDTSRRPLDILTDLMTAAAGVLTYPQATFKIFPAGYDAPAVTLDAGDLRGPVRTVSKLPRRDLFNAVKGVYSNPANFWQPSDFPGVTNTVYEGQDGDERIWRDLQLPFTTDAIRAQRIAKIHLEKSRQGLTTQWPCKMTAFPIALWETVNLSLPRYGWTPKVFRVIGWKLGADGIGVDLTLREDTAASYDWAAGDATVVDPAPDTNLPNPFTVGLPGVPTVTEELYETSGSAGVKSRALIEWGASADAFVLAYEAQYKAAADTVWLSLPPTGGLSLSLDDISPGSYNFRLRAINSLGVRSAWTATVTREIQGLTALPGNVANFSVVASAGFALASWTLTEDLDVRIGGRVVVRHAPVTSGATWSGALILDEFAGSAVSGTVPLITGTYLAKFRDSAGSYSATETTFVATEGLVTGLTTLATITESTAFTGTKTNLTVSAGTLKLDSAVLIDSVASFDAITDLDMLGGVAATGSYAFNGTYSYDGTTVATRRFEADIAVAATDTGDFIDARVNNIDDWDSIDGSIVNDCDVTLYASTTNDNPAGSPVWGAWTPFMVADFNCRAARFKLDFVSGSITHNIACSLLAVVVKA